MSLLTDALRNAEKAKRQNGESKGSGTATVGPSKLTLEPFAPSSQTVVPHSPLPVLDSVNAELAAYSTANMASPTKAASNKPLAVSAAPEARISISNDEKGRVMLAVEQEPKLRTRRWLLLGLLGITVLGIGGYFWWQLQSVSKGSFIMRPIEAATVEPALPALSPAPNVPTAAPLAPAPNLTRSLSAAEGQPKPQVPAHAPPQTQSDNPIRLSSRQPTANPILERAYQALKAERLSDARHDYEQVLRSDARNVDALLGLATIAARQGQTGNAADLYRRALEADPKDVNAQAGLINLIGQTDPELSESRLKTLLAGQPDSSHSLNSSALNFALGNLHAKQSRWSDAQLAYFRAYTAEPGNADYIYNLAVSLDHLHQNKLAAQYYQSALDAAGSRHSAFDKDQIKSRLLDLQP